MIALAAAVTWGARAPQNYDDEEYDNLEALEDVVRRTGDPVAWLVRADGTVFVQMPGQTGKGTVEASDLGTDEVGAEKPIWFATPAQQTAKAEFEEQVVDLIVAIEAGHVSAIRIVSERDFDKTGETPGEALPMRWIESVE